LREALAGGVSGADALDELGREGGGAARRSGRSSRLARGPAPLGEEPLEFVGRDQACAPRHLDGLDVREDASVEGGAADAEGLGCLGACVREPLDARRLADDRLRLPVAPFLGCSSAVSAARHPCSVHEL
jgi:hypothetical protein